MSPPLPQDRSRTFTLPLNEDIVPPINLDLMKSKSFNYLYNHIRMLDDPYPNAFVIINKKKIFIKKIHKKRKKINQKYISKKTKFTKNLNGYFICLKDSDAKIIESFK